MTEIRTTLQPGPVFYSVFTGILRAYGLTLQDWSKARGIKPANVRAAAHGSWNGPGAKALRASMVTYVGEDAFRQLYAEHIDREFKGAA